MSQVVCSPPAANTVCRYLLNTKGLSVNSTGKKLRLTTPAASPSPKLRLKKVQEAKQPKVEPRPSDYPLPGYPKEDGPRNPPQDVFNDKTGMYSVTMDRGTFWYVWSMVEARARDDHRKYSFNPGFAHVTLDAVGAFRHTYYAQHPKGGKPKPKLRLKGK